MSGLLHFRAAHQYAKRFDEHWANKSEDTFLRWLKQLDKVAVEHGEPRVIRRLTPGLHAPIYVSQRLLHKALDADDRSLDVVVAEMDRRLRAAEAAIVQLQRRVLGASG